MPVSLPLSEDRRPRKLTYIAGPMRGYPKFNFEAFFDAEDSLNRLGWECLNPARMDLQANPDIKDPDLLPTGKMWEYVERDVHALNTIAKAVAEEGVQGAVHFLPGWHKSKGATAEHAVAQWLKLECIYL